MYSVKLKIALLIIILSSLLLSQTQSLPTDREIELSKTVAQLQFELMTKDTQLVAKNAELTLKDKEIDLAKKESNLKNDELFWARVKEIGAYVVMLAVALK